MKDIIQSLEIIMNGFQANVVCMLYILIHRQWKDHLFGVSGQDMQKDDHISMYEEIEFEYIGCKWYVRAPSIKNSD